MPLTDNLISHLNLNDNAASTVVVASVGSNGTLNGGDNTSVKFTTGPTANIPDAFALNGTDDSITITSPSIATTVPFTVHAWIKPAAFGGRVVLGAGSGSFASYISLSSNTAVTVRLGAGAQNAFTLPTISTSAWTMLTVTKDTSNDVRVYKNGVQSSTGALAGGTGNFGPVRIGESGLGWFSGTIAAVSIANRLWSDAEILELYNSGSGLAFPWATGGPHSLVDGGLINRGLVNAGLVA